MGKARYAGDAKRTKTWWQEISCSGSCVVFQLLLLFDHINSASLGKLPESCTTPSLDMTLKSKCKSVSKSLVSSFSPVSVPTNVVVPESFNKPNYCPARPNI